MELRIPKILSEILPPTTVDACFSCSTAMSCYDYKSKSACERDNCGVINCRWEHLSEELGTGVCVNTRQNNCEFCGVQGSAGMDNLETHNDLFEACSAEKADKLSVSGYFFLTLKLPYSAEIRRVFAQKKCSYN